MVHMVHIGREWHERRAIACHHGSLAMTIKVRGKRVRMGFPPKNIYTHMMRACMLHLVQPKTATIWSGGIAGKASGRVRLCLRRNHAIRIRMVIGMMQPISRQMCRQQRFGLGRETIYSQSDDNALENADGIQSKFSSSPLLVEL